MKAIIKNYTFNATAKTVTLTDFTTVLLERLQLIVDTTTNVILYNFADPTVATATIATNVITLSTVRSANVSDKLQIIYDVATGDPTYDVQPVSAASLPLPAGAATSSKQPALGTAGSPSTDVISVQGVASGTPQPISASSLPLPTGAAQESGNLSAIKTDADLIVTNTSNTATNTSNILSVEGGTSDTAVTTDANGTISSKLRGLVKMWNDIWDSTNHRIKVDGSGVTQPISGTVTSNIGTTNGLALDATLTGGTQQTQGNVTSGSADSGNPVKVGGKFNNATPTFTDGNRADLQLTSRGGLKVQVVDGANSINAVTSGSDNSSNTFTALNTLSYPMVYNGSWDRKRTPNIFKTATATASGDTAVWTPTSGKKFRLMRYMIEITNDAATSGGADIDIILRDGTTGMAASFTVYVPASGGTTVGATSTHWIDLGNGQLSAAANNVLNVNLSAALTSGKVRVIAVGCEE